MLLRSCLVLLVLSLFQSSSEEGSGWWLDFLQQAWDGYLHEIGEPDLCEESALSRLEFRVVVAPSFEPPVHYRVSLGTQTGARVVAKRSRIVHDETDVALAFDGTTVVELSSADAAALLHSLRDESLWPEHKSQPTEDGTIVYLESRRDGSCKYSVMGDVGNARALREQLETIAAGSKSCGA